MLKSNTSDVYSYKFIEIKTDSVHDQLLEKTLNINYAVILIMTFF